jgi:rhamnogalacturonan endolyase
LDECLTSATLTRSSPDIAEAVLTGGPTVYFPFTVEVHYILMRGVSGFYGYVVYRHTADLPAASLGQTRFVLRGPPGDGIYTNHIVDDNRKGPFDTSPIVRQVSDATFLLQDGSVYCKYDNTAFMADHHVHGMAGHGVGVWMINASNECVNGGPVKQELTVHEDNTLLNMLQGGHDGAGSLDLTSGAVWTKFYGPFLVYFNHGASIDDMYSDAKSRAKVAQNAWPYSWLHDPDYPVQRGTVAGRLRLTDGESASGAWIVLAAPGGDWPMQCAGYEFWTRADGSGRFDIPKVRPGTYALYAYGADQFEQFEQDGVMVVANQTAQLGTLDWKPVTHGRTLWQIGTPDRSTEEFRGGADDTSLNGMRHWANFMRYPTDFPNDVTFVIGKSREQTDWNYAQWTWYCKNPYWTIQFNLSTAPVGHATLTVGIAASLPLHGSHTNTEIKVNGQHITTLHLPKSGAAAYRSGGEDSDYQIEYVTFDAALLKSGENTITLGDQDAQPFPTPDVQMQGHVGAVMYDAIRLEVGP